MDRLCTKKAVMPKKKVIAARNLKDWTKFTTQINETTNKNAVFLTQQFDAFLNRIGADDIFVFMDAYVQSAYMGPSVCRDMETRFRYSLYLHYCYKSTNTDAEGGWSWVYFLYWDKSTNSDALC